MLLKKAMFGIVIAGALTTTASLAFSQNVSTGSVKTSSVVSADSQRKTHGPLPRAFSGLWVPILTTGLAGFTYVRSKHQIL